MIYPISNSSKILYLVAVRKLQVANFFSKKFSKSYVLHKLLVANSYVLHKLQLAKKNFEFFSQLQFVENIGISYQQFVEYIGLRKNFGKK